MKLSQEDKETIYSNYMQFVSTMCDDLDTFSEVSPKELVYAVLGLVEYELNSPPQGSCPNCRQGSLKELSIYDDWEGMLTCDKCGLRGKK